jgi:hypothetical protein
MQDVKRLEPKPTKRDIDLVAATYWRRIMFRPQKRLWTEPSTDYAT